VALVAATAIALAAWLAAAAQGGAGIGSVGIPPVMLAVALVPGVVATALRRSSARVLPEGKDVVVLTAVTVLGAGILYVAGWTDAAHAAAIARLLPVAVAVLALLWPEPSVLRYCVVLSGGSLLGAAVGASASGEAFVAALAALAVGLVATNRVAGAAAPRLGAPAGTEGRRVGREAGIVLVVAGLLAAFAATLLPPPPGRGGPQQDNRRRSRPAPASPSLGAADRLDVGAGRGRPSNAVLFRVAAPGPDLWRVNTYDHWDGAAWQRSPDDPLPGLDLGERTFVRPGVGDVVGLGADFLQRVTIEAASAAVLPAAAVPRFVTLPAGLVRVGRAASLRPDQPLGRGETYVVESARDQADPRDLRNASGPVPPSVGDLYLQLPQVAPAVRALAVQVTAGATTAYDQARALEVWLQDNTRVTDTAAAVPAGADPLEQFLLTDRSGPAERSASSMAVMLRALGVPTRLAAGFLPGRREGLRGDFVVRGRHAFAWVEVWFPGIGWQRFDPTGLAPAPGARDDSLWSRLKRLAAQLWPLLVLAVLAIVGWLAWRAERARRRRASQPWVTRFFARLERAGRVRGRPRRPEETPSEYVSELAGSVLPDPRLGEVGELVTVAAYSGREVAPEDRARAERVLKEAARAAPPRRLRRHTSAQPAHGPTIRQP
jgi:transglutaminase-like putative cysteine protease